MSLFSGYGYLYSGSNKYSSVENCTNCSLSAPAIFVLLQVRETFFVFWKKRTYCKGKGMKMAGAERESFCIFHNITPWSTGLDVLDLIAF